MRGDVLQTYMPRRGKPQAKGRKGPSLNQSIKINIGPNGRVLIRPIRPQDADLYQAFADRISVDDRRRRFLYAGPKELTPALLAQFTQLDSKREMALVAIDEFVNELYGVARFVIDPAGDAAEFAVVIRSDLQQQGLGRALMQELIKYARTTKISQLRGSVSADNTAMLHMCRKLGFENRDGGDGSLRQIVLSLRKVRSALVAS